MDNLKIGEFLPCPFCGCDSNPVKKNSRVFNDHTEVDYYLECDDCELIIGNDREYDQWGDNFCDYKTPEEALAFWNKRSNI